MNDNIEPPSAERWRSLAEDAQAVAEVMTEPEAKRIMRKIAEGYVHMALNAEARDAGPPVIRSESTPEPGAA